MFVILLTIYCYCYYCHCFMFTWTVVMFLATVIIAIVIISSYSYSDSDSYLHVLLYSTRKLIANWFFFIFDINFSNQPVLVQFTRIFSFWTIESMVEMMETGHQWSPGSPACSEVTVGYTQGLNFTAAVLSCTMGRDEAFWCLTALAEWVAAHFVSGNMLQGAVADCECGWPGWPGWPVSI